MDFLDFMGAGGDNNNDAVPVESDSEDESSPSPSTLIQQSMTRLLTMLSGEAFVELNTAGYKIVDNAFLPECAQMLAAEIAILKDNQRLELNATAYVSEHVEGEKPRIDNLIRKPGIFETELTDDVRAANADLSPHLNALYTALPSLEAHLRRHLPPMDIQVAKGLGSIKLQYNIGFRACFPFHFDSPGGRKDTRRITMLLYLNEGWKEGDGGEIVFQPFLASQVQVRPLFNRIVMFKSAEMLHRVLPSNSVRRCLTMWLHGLGDADEDSEKADKEAAAGEDFASIWMKRLATAKWQRVLCKVVYGTEWCNSYFQAHGRLPEDLDKDLQQVTEKLESTKVEENASSPSSVASSSAVSYPAPVAGSDGGAPLVASLQRDRAALEKELGGTGILDLLQQTANEKKSKIIRL